ncbi:hypothetical protein [Rhodopila sp.]|uniref:hypothetical protein n=1 Tax=Rhodopila sp. TaxID=2480087 RepID=UPI002D7ED01E|nr:hypothetical protein [Rhodopila sp.]
MSREREIIRLGIAFVVAIILTTAVIIAVVQGWHDFNDPPLFPDPPHGEVRLPRA